MISSNLKIIDGNIEHNQVLDVAEYTQNNNIKLPEILKNTDIYTLVPLTNPKLRKERKNTQDFKLIKS